MSNINVRINISGSKIVEVNRAAWQRAFAAGQIAQLMEAATDAVEPVVWFTVLEDLATEPPTPVAAGPVDLDAQVARELAYLSEGVSDGGWTVVENEQFGSGRWESHHTLVIRNAAGEHFRSTYSRGLTEYQDTGPWEGEKSARFDPVERRVKVVQVVEWIAAQPAQTGDAA